MKYYGIGAAKLVEIWIEREIVIRNTAANLGFGHPRHLNLLREADTIRQMRRQLQEAADLVVDPEKIVKIENKPE